MMNVIDLFAGCGGLSLGFYQNGFTIKKAVEFDDQIAQTYKFNHPDVDLIVDDIAKVDTAHFFNKYDADIIVGGPPCQGFSMAGARIRNGFISDPRNYLFKHYLNIVKNVKPKIFIMENVKGITTMQNGEIFNEIIKSFSDKDILDGIKYDMYYKVVKAVDFGVPQKRERMIIIGTTIPNVNFDELWELTRCEIKSEKPDFFERVTVADAIDNLSLTTIDGNIENPRPKSEYQQYLSCDNDVISNHTKTKHSKLALERMTKIRNGENFSVLDEKINSVHSGAYGRLSWGEPSPTITTRFDTPAGGRFIHPVENRTISPREAARLQSFPDDFIFKGTKTSICKQIGNAVPPKISYFLARLVKNIINSEV